MCQRRALLNIAFFVLYFGTVCASLFGRTTQKPETWTGRWLPERLPVEITTTVPEISDPLHGIKMGVSSALCDDAQTNLTLDWDYSPINYTCFSRFRIIPDARLNSILEKENIPPLYIARHKCMDQPIDYDVLLPTFGTHRPLWPRFGEYKFLPRQRWLHNLEHGGIVALYHPCADPLEVSRLRQIVKNCLWRHVISPSNFLDPERPFALLAWGWRLTMPTAEPDIMKNFILEHALHGPEAIYRDGQFDVGLLTPAKVITTQDDNQLCP